MKCQGLQRLFSTSALILIWCSLLHLDCAHTKGQSEEILRSKPQHTECFSDFKIKFVLKDTEYYVHKCEYTLANSVSILVLLYH